MRIFAPTFMLCIILAGCNGIDLGDNPRPDVAKQQGPLTVPPQLQPRRPVAP